MSSTYGHVLDEYQVPIDSRILDGLSAPSWIVDNAKLSQFRIDAAYPGLTCSTEWLSRFLAFLESATVTAAVTDTRDWWLKLTYGEGQLQGDIYIAPPSDSATVRSLFETAGVSLGDDKLAWLASFANLSAHPLEAGGLMSLSDMVSPVANGWCITTDGIPDAWRSAIGFYCSPGGEVAILKKDGAVGWLRLTSSTIVDAAPSLGDFVAQFTDCCVQHPNDPFDSMTKDRYLSWEEEKKRYGVP